MAFRQKSNDVDTLFDKEPKPSIEQLLNCQSLVEQYRSNNKRLISRLMEEDIQFDLYKFILETKEKAKEKLFTSLFQTSNNLLHEVFCKNIRITEFIISQLDSTPEPSNFKIGIITRLISRAFDIWPEETSELFRVSKILYPIIIKHLDKSSVFQSIADFMNDTHPGLTLFIWHCFMAISKKKYEGENRPLCVYLESDLELDFAITDKHIYNIINLLKQFFEFKEGKAGGMENCVIDYISETSDLNPELFAVAKFIGPNEKVAKAALNCIQKYHHDKSHNIEQAICYLTICTNLVGFDTLESIVFFLLTKENPTSFILIALEQLATELTKHSSHDQNQYKNDLVSLVACVWYKLQNLPLLENEDFDVSTNSDVMRPFILNLGLLALDAESEVSGWKDFCEKCLNSWKEGQKVMDETHDLAIPDFNFKFEDGVWDTALIENMAIIFDK